MTGHWSPARAVELYLEDERRSASEVGRMLGVTPAKVLYAIERAGVPKKDFAVVNGRRTVDYEAVVARYQSDARLSVPTVAKEFGLADATTSRILRVMGVPIRNTANRWVYDPDAVCSSCQINSLPPDNRNRSTMCDECYARYKRDYHLKRSYGITLEHYEEMAAKQNGRCALCGSTPDTLVVDHCHETKVVRGLLCLRCNAAMGSFGDNIEGIRKVVEYLERSIAS